MKLSEIINEAQWKKVGNLKGVLSRHITPQEREEAKRKEAERNKKRYAASKEGKLEELRVTPIPELSSNEVEDIIKSSLGAGIGGEIDHFTEFKNTTTVIDGVKVAAAKVGLYIAIDLVDMYGQETVDSMYNGNSQAEEIVKFIIYRDPKNPTQFKANYS